ncbi:MAG: hypothetical protein DLM61_03295 [Pseudonocardiales bacterium]|nr:MAG: hypothetical protein DLM61_03295 [Pseudonocardiales bacterium]
MICDNANWDDASWDDEIWDDALGVAEYRASGIDADGVDGNDTDRPARNAASDRPGAVHDTCAGSSDKGTNSTRSARSPTAPSSRRANRRKRASAGNEVSQPCRVHQRVNWRLVMRLAQPAVTVEPPLPRQWI